MVSTNPGKPVASGALSVPGNGPLESPSLERFGAQSVSRPKQRSRSACDVARKDSGHRPKLVPAKIKATTVAHQASSNFLHPVSANTHCGYGSMGRSRSVGDLGKNSNVSSTTSSSASTNASNGSNVSPKTSPGASTKASNGSNVSSKTSSSASTKASNGSGCKRIPAYDYKARFTQLQVKHKALLEKYQKELEENESLQDMYDERSQELVELKQRHEQLVCEVSGAHDEKRLLEETNAQLTAALERLESDLKLYRDKYTAVSKEKAELKRQLAELEERSNFLETKNMALEETNDRNAELLFQANIERKDLHNMVMDLRGNIRVFCRVRPPLLPSEEQRIECGWKYLDEQSLELLAMDGTGKRYEFSFDRVFQARTTQKDIFENVSPLIQSALDGYNVCIFAYGQMGSGKTYTMDGVPDNVGVIPRTVDLIFNAINDYKRFGWEYEIRVNFLEIYNEVLYDLLDIGTSKDHKILSTKNKTDVYVSNIIEETVETPGRLHQLMSIAKMNRRTAATAGNERSSRSHAVTKIILIGRHQEKGETCVGSVNLVDLAGSESPKTSTRMDETKNINRSLSELTNVMLALMQHRDHVPYRNSKLTHLLMPFLGGNSKTLMFVNVAPFQDCFNNTLAALHFAELVKTCKMP